MDILRDTPRKKIIFLVSAIIFFQIALSAFFMAFEKKGFYADDMYSYGFANSNGYSTPVADKDLTILDNRWIDGSMIMSYLTVSEDEIFSYDSVINILEHDAHPPLFYILLHAICSLTPNIFSRWSAFVINVAGFILIQIYLYRLSLIISKNRTISLLIMTFFGFCSASVNMMCLLRMYVLATGFTIAFTYYAFRYHMSSSGHKTVNADLLLASLFLYLGSMTVYLSIMFAFFYTAYICIYLLFTKQPKKMFSFGFFMLLSVGLMFLCFPIVVKQLTADQSALSGAVAYPYMLQIRTALHVILNGLFGIFTPIFPSMLPYYCLWTLIALTVLYLLACFIFRHDEWFKVLRSKVLHTVINLIRRSLPYCKTLLPIFGCCIVIILIFAKGLRLYYYRYDGMRYYYILTPFITMTLLMVLFKLVSSVYIQSALTVLLIAASLIFGNKSFLESEFVTEDIDSITTGANVVVVENYSIEFMYHIMDVAHCSSFMYTNPRSLYNNIPTDSIIEKSKENRDMILILNLDATELSPTQTTTLSGETGLPVGSLTPDNEISRYFKSFPEFSDMEYLGAFGTCYIYRLK